MTTLHLGDIDVDVILKDIKNVHLSVHPPYGRVRIAAPSRMKLDNIRLYAISKLDWIKTQQRQLRAQPRETPREYLERESHYVWGKRYLLKVVEHEAPPSIELRPRNLITRVRPGTDVAKREQLLDQWYRQQVKQETQSLIEKWQPILGVRVANYFVQPHENPLGQLQYRFKNHPNQLRVRQKGRRVSRVYRSSRDGPLD